MRPVEVVIVEAAACHLCDDAAQVIQDEARDHPLAVRHVGLTSEEGRSVLRSTRAVMTPIVLVDGELLGWGRLSRGKLRRRLRQLDPVGRA